MPKNMGTLDRVLRIIVAIVLAYLAYTGALAGGLALGAYIVAAVFLVTSLVGFCPAYRLIGVDTCGKG
jgi:uncharacterized membrane protein